MSKYMSALLEKTFVESFSQGFDLGSMSFEAQEFVKGLGRQQKDDFTNSVGGYLSHESQVFIAKESASRLVKALSPKKAPEVTVRLLQQDWQGIVSDFHKSNYWDQVPQKNKPPRLLTEDQKRVHELAPYIWVAFQAWIVMKLVITYFGYEAADNPDETHWMLYCAMAFSFGSLIFFAWRKSKKGE